QRRPDPSPRRPAPAGRVAPRGAVPAPRRSRVPSLGAVGDHNGRVVRRIDADVRPRAGGGAARIGRAPGGREPARGGAPAPGRGRCGSTLAAGGGALPAALVGAAPEAGGVAWPGSWSWTMIPTSSKR